MKFLYIFMLLGISAHSQTISNETIITVRPDFLLNIYGDNDTIKVHLIDNNGIAFYFLDFIDSAYVCRISYYSKGKLLSVSEYIRQNHDRWLLITSDSNGNVKSQGILIETKSFITPQDTIFLTRPDPPYETIPQVIKYRRTIKDGTWTYFDPYRLETKRIMFKDGVEVK